MSNNSDDFGSFLESVQRASKSGGAENTSNVKIMMMLVRLGEVEMSQLVAVIDLSWSDFANGIESLKSAGLVTINETKQGGKVKLTDEGQRWANALSSD